MNLTQKKTFNPVLIYISLAVLLTAVLFSGCKHDPVQTPDNNPTVSDHCDGDTVYFQNEILPLLINNCATSGCHNPSSAKEGIVLTSYATVITTGELNLTNPSDSKIYRAMTDGGDDRMPPPPADALSYDQTAKVLRWIEQGALNNQCVENEQGCDTTAITFYGSVDSIFQKHCYGCHTQPTPASNIDLKNWDDIARIVNNGALIGSVTHSAGYSPMPKGYNISDCEIAIIVKWANDTTLTDPGGGGGNPDPCDPDTVYFQNSVLPLLVSNCATSGCHDQTTHKEGVNLTNYTSIINTGKVKPGNPSGSKLYKVLFGGEMRDDDIMPPPPASPFSADQKKIIYDWILQGALNNSCDGDCDSTNVTFSGTIWPMMQTWCTGCHTGTNAGGNIHIENYNNVVAIANNGSLMGTITHSAGFVAMPKNSDKLSDCQIASVRKWIEDGTPNN